MSDELERAKAMLEDLATEHPQILPLQMWERNAELWEIVQPAPALCQIGPLVVPAAADRVLAKGSGPVAAAEELRRRLEI